ncbi:hypothetical protein V6N13_051238 [Hibiscus sabdariffa]|uniref:Uncharacterized protein n=1 Tax=Hibiscus sabdariffa TaxID=183260 RepID=A0ABR2T3K0_9ROSI
MVHGCVLPCPTDRPRGRISFVEDDTDAPVTAKSPSEGPPANLDSTKAHGSDSDSVAPAVAASVAPTPSVPASATVAEILHDPLAPSEAANFVGETVDDASLDPETSEIAVDRLAPEDAPYDPMVHTETSDMLEEALEILSDCVLLADLAGVIQANGEDLFNEAIPKAADSIIRDVAASVLGVSATADATVTSSRPTPTPTASPPNLGLSRSAPACPRHAPMPVVPEHQEFDAWYAAQSRTPPVTMQNQPAVARNSSIPPSRPHKRQASSSDLSKTKRSRPSTSSTTRIPSVPKAGIGSVNNSSTETVRQSRREK